MAQWPNGNNIFDDNNKAAICGFIHFRLLSVSDFKCSKCDKTGLKDGNIIARGVAPAIKK